MGSPASRAKRTGKPSANAGNANSANANPQTQMHREIPQHVPEPEPAMVQPASQCGTLSDSNISTANGSNRLADDFRSVSQGDGHSVASHPTADGSNTHPNVTQAFL